MHSEELSRDEWVRRIADRRKSTSLNDLPVSFNDLYSAATIEEPFKDEASTRHTWNLSQSGELELQHHGKKVYLVQHEARPSSKLFLSVENLATPGRFGLWVRFRDEHFMNAKIRFSDAKFNELEVVDVPKSHAEDVLVMSKKAATWAFWEGNGALFWAAELKP